MHKCILHTVYILKNTLKLYSRKTIHLNSCSNLFPKFSKFHKTWSVLPQELRHDTPVSDGRWHRVSATFRPDRLEISVDGVTKYSAPSRGANKHIDLTDRLYIGGIQVNWNMLSGFLFQLSAEEKEPCPSSWGEERQSCSTGLPEGCGAWGPEDRVAWCVGDWGHKTWLPLGLPLPGACVWTGRDLLSGGSGWLHVLVWGATLWSHRHYAVSSSGVCSSSRSVTETHSQLLLLIGFVQIYFLISFSETSNWCWIWGPLVNHLLLYIFFALMNS